MVILLESLLVVLNFAVVLLVAVLVLAPILVHCLPIIDLYHWCGRGLVEVGVGVARVREGGSGGGGIWRRGKRGSGDGGRSFPPECCIIHLKTFLAFMTYGLCLKNSFYDSIIF